VKLTIDVPDDHLALFRKILACEGFLTADDADTIDTAQANLVAAVVAEADRQANPVNIGLIARECLAEAGGHKLQAIRGLRERTGLSLKESKEAIEAVTILCRLPVWGQP
jgi:ribosomal protein L7/L12